MLSVTHRLPPGQPIFLPRLTPTPEHSSVLRVRSLNNEKLIRKGMIRIYSATPEILVALGRNADLRWISIPESASPRFRISSDGPNSHVLAGSTEHFPGFEHTNPSIPLSTKPLACPLNQTGIDSDGPTEKPT
jgi:hypothetical protein